MNQEQTSEHGTRASYHAGCRCLPCRSANASYEAARSRRPANVMVDAAAARLHLRHLQKHLVGHHQAARLSGLSWVLLYGIRSGRRQRIRASTEARVLAIPAEPAGGVRINSYATRHLIRALLGEDFTFAELAKRAGLHLSHHSPTAKKSRARSITLRKARAVRQYHLFITAE